MAGLGRQGSQAQGTDLGSVYHNNHDTATDQCQRQDPPREDPSSIEGEAEEGFRQQHLTMQQLHLRQDAQGRRADLTNPQLQQKEAHLHLQFAENLCQIPEASANPKQKDSRQHSFQKRFEFLDHEPNLLNGSFSGSASSDCREDTSWQPLQASPTTPTGPRWDSLPYHAAHFSATNSRHSFKPKDHHYHHNLNGLDRQFCFPESRNEHDPSIATPSTMYRPDSRQQGQPAHGTDKYNFSRPGRRPSSSLRRPDTAQSFQSDSSHLETHHAMSSSIGIGAPYSNRPPRRYPSMASNMSNASAPTSLHQKPSSDSLKQPHRNGSLNTSTAYAMGPPSPHRVRPQLSPLRHNQGHAPSQYPQHRQQSPWLSEDEMRSSLRSQLTTSTAQGTGYDTLFTEPERSSVSSKKSMTLEEVMDMYLYDEKKEEAGIPAAVGLAPADFNHDDSRPGSALSHNDDMASKTHAAMSGPISIPPRTFPLNGDRSFETRDSVAIFGRKSLSTSLPKSMRFSLAATAATAAKEEEKAWTGDHESDELHDDDDCGSKHDSGKMLEPHSNEVSPLDAEFRHDDYNPSISPTPSLSLDLNTTDSATTDQLSPLPLPPVHTPGLPRPEDEDPNSSDRYGFRKQNQYITREQYDEWNGPYTEYLARRRKKWEAFLKESHLVTDKPERFPPPSAKARRFIRKGIPPEWRGAAWFYYAGGPKILANNQGVYDLMLKRANGGELKEVSREDIERDLYRTFPDNVRFRRAAPPVVISTDGSGPVPSPGHSRANSTQSANPTPKAPGSEPEIIASLRRVLSAFAVFNPHIGYCQSLNFLGGMLLLFVESEEQAFWLLNIITRVYLPGTHEMSLEGSKVDLIVLMSELQNVLPHVWAKISDDGSTTRKKKPKRRNKHSPLADSDLPPVTLALTAWFMSCYIGTLPLETTLRVWDVFFYEGPKTFFRVALAIFKAGDGEIKAIHDPMEVFAVVQSLPRKMLDANLLMETCFKRRSGLNHVTGELIDEQRTVQKEKLKFDREKARQEAGIIPAATMGASSSSAVSIASEDTASVGRKHTLFGRRKEKERPKVVEV